jgi:hypothetical protein
VLAEAAAEHKRDTIPVDASVHNNMQEKKMKNGTGVSFLIDVTNDNEVMDMCNDIL